jgi:hypothetical protein
MKLAEIKDPKAQSDMPGWIAVPRGSLWQKDIKNCWAFPDQDSMHTAIYSEAGQELIDKLNGGYLMPVETLNGVWLILAMSEKTYHDIKDYEKENGTAFHVYAYSISEKSCRAAALKAMQQYGIKHDTNFARGDNVWCYMTWNSDISYFEDDE